MLLLLLLLLMVSGFFLFVTKKKTASILIFCFFLSNGFQIFPESLLADYPINKLFDFGLLYVLLLCIYLALTKKGFLKLNDPIAKIIFLMLIFFTLQLIYTVSTSHETFEYAFKVYRQYIFLLSYFIVRNMKSGELGIVIKRLFVITSFVGVLYVLQIVLKTQILTGAVDDINATNKVPRFRNNPVFTDFFLFFIFFTGYQRKWKTFFIFLMLACFLLPMNRAPIFAFAAVSSLYLLLERKFGTFVKYSLMLLLVICVCWPFISYRFEQNDSKSDLTRAFQLRDYNSYDPSQGGTFDFRVALLLERIDYLKSNPENILFGVGMRHDDSPRTEHDFNFLIGTTKLQDGKTMKQQLDTPDLVWAAVLIRFGLAGVVIYIVLFWYFIKFFIKNRQEFYAVVALLLIAMYIILSLETDTLIRPTTLFMVFLCYVTISQTQKISIKT